MHRLLRIEWDAIAGVVAAIAAIVLHFLHVIDTEVLAVITLVLIAAMFLRLLRSEHGQRRVAAGVERGERLLGQLVRGTKPPDVLVIGPREIRAASTEFSRGAAGEMVWFNVCLSMFERQPLFDALLRPAIENPAVTAVTFVLDERQRERWDRDVWPKVGGLRWRRQGRSAALVQAARGRLVHSGGQAGYRNPGVPAQLLGRTIHVAARWPRRAALHLPRDRTLGAGRAPRGRRPRAPAVAIRAGRAAVSQRRPACSIRAHHRCGPRGKTCFSLRRKTY